MAKLTHKTNHHTSRGWNQAKGPTCGWSPYLWPPRPCVSSSERAVGGVSKVRRSEEMASRVCSLIKRCLYVSASLMHDVVMCYLCRRD